MRLEAHPLEHGDQACNVTLVLTPTEAARYGYVAPEGMAEIRVKVVVDLDGLYGMIRGALTSKGGQSQALGGAIRVRRGR